MAASDKRSATTSEQIDNQLALAAREKHRKGQKPTTQEASALRRVEKRLEEQKRWEYYESVPQKHWRHMAGGVQTKQLHDAEENHGAPIGRSTISLPEFVRWFHRFLAANARKLAGPEIDDPLLAAGGDSPALERYRLAKAKLAEHEYDNKMRETMPRADVHLCLARIGTGLRGLGERLERRCGAEAHQLLNETLDDIWREIDSLFVDDDGNRAPEPLGNQPSP